MVKQAPRRITAIAADEDIFGLGRENERVNRQMGFDEAPVRLLFEASDDPWSFKSRWYEARKRALTLAALPKLRYGRAYEPGCAALRASRRRKTSCASPCSQTV